MPAATPTMESQVADLIKQGASQQEAIETVVKSVTDLKKHLDEPQYPAVRAHAGDGTLSYFDHEGVSRHKTIVRQGAGYSGLPSSFGIPKGFKNDVPEFATIGKFLQYGMKHHKEADFQTKHAGCFKAIQGMSEGVASDGGYMVLLDQNMNILERVYDNDLFKRLDQYTVSGNANGMVFRRNAETSRANGSRHGGMQALWTDEGQSTTASSPTLKSLALRLKKLVIVVYLTEELLADARALEQYVVGKVPQEFNFKLGDAIFNGTGGGMPTGLLTSAALISIAKETGQEADSILSENIDKMWQRRFGSGTYRWYKNRDTEAQLATLYRGVGVGGDLVYNPPGGIADAPYATLKGAGVEDTEFNPSLGNQGDIVLADLSQIVAITKGGIEQAMSTHVEFLTGQTALRFTFRVDLRPWEDSPLTPFKGTNTQSAFITLDERA